MQEVKLAKSSGFCFGVRRAVQMAEELAQSGKSACTLGPIIHNTHVVEKLAKDGVPSIANVEDIPPGTTVLIRSHGVSADVYRALEARGLPYADATCPYVEKIHQIVRDAAKDGMQIIIIGTKKHPEVLGIAGHCENPLIFDDINDLKTNLLKLAPVDGKPLCVVSQTTMEREFWEESIEFIKKEYTNCKIFDTICFATCKRQLEARALAQQADAMIVIGDKTSSNTKALVSICEEECGVVYHIESAEELKAELPDGIVGITAGASTPDWIIKEVKNKMSEAIKNETMEKSFEELLAESFKTLNNGDKVVGIVTAITPTEIYLDLGTKHAGFLPLSEVTDDPSVKPEEMCKVGDEIEVSVVRVNDVEGVVTVSKRRLDALKNWDEIETARQDKAVVEGIVTEMNKGGIVVSVKGVRVFVPASQSGLPKDADLATMLKTKVRLRITEVNRMRRRVVGSIRSVQFEERRAAAEKIWGEIEVGNTYKGVVKSIMSYGVFVDIGGVDGMLHISEMSWKRIGHPSELFKVGDVVEVAVIALDTEKKKISLGYRKEEDNPWTKFTAQYNVGDVATVKIVKMMPFGAFAEVIDGVDGLIHISQITDRRIARPSDVLSEGQEVEAKITEINLDTKKISLSMRALIEPEVAPVEEAVNAEDEIVASTDAEETVVAEDVVSDETAE